VPLTFAVEGANFAFNFVNCRLQLVGRLRGDGLCPSQHIDLHLKAGQKTQAFVVRSLLLFRRMARPATPDWGINRQNASSSKAIRATILLLCDSVKTRVL
jgi:hypothetical protein